MTMAPPRKNPSSRPVDAGSLSAMVVILPSPERGDGIGWRAASPAVPLGLRAGD
jgi:hypothetical protein